MSKRIASFLTGILCLITVQGMSHPFVAVPAVSSPDATFFSPFNLAHRLVTVPPPGDIMPDKIQQYEEDISNLDKVYIFKDSPEYFERMSRYNQAALADLQRMDFKSLSVSDQVDYLLLQRNIRHALQELDQARGEYGQVQFAIPFAQKIMDLQVKRRRGAVPDAPGTALVLDSVRIDIGNARRLMEKRSDLPLALVKKIIGITESVRAGLKNTWTFYADYDPVYTWWVEKPYKAADSLLDAYSTYLHSRVTGDSAFVSPIGEDKLKELLKYEMVVYGPNDLVDIANRQFAWCEAEMKKASAAMGFGGDWKKALEKVKQNHVEPGKQPELIDRLAEQAIQFVESHDLVTVPPLAKEVWRMYMLSPEQQRFAPFFLGGESILVAYPTEDMDQETKIMSLRSNNYGFAHATVFHELIPGHNLQGFMNSRYKSYRWPFETPFSVEGWALYWEMLLWDKGFHQTPEEKVGALFWRMHRCARIIFSLNYHLGKWTPKQCIDFLVEKVGHERFSAESEVRRSFTGNYGPLYQIAYMLGGLQMRALHHELVDAGKIREKDFHDAFLHESAIPIEMFRAIITKEELATDHQATWRFADELK